MQPEHGPEPLPGQQQSTPRHEARKKPRHTMHSVVASLRQCQAHQRRGPARARAPVGGRLQHGLGERRRAADGRVHAQPQLVLVHLFGALDLLAVGERKDVRVVALRDLKEGLCQQAAHHQAHQQRHGHEHACTGTPARLSRGKRSRAGWEGARSRSRACKADRRARLQLVLLKLLANARLCVCGVQAQPVLDPRDVHHRPEVLVARPLAPPLAPARPHTGVAWPAAAHDSQRRAARQGAPEPTWPGGGAAPQRRSAGGRAARGPGGRPTPRRLPSRPSRPSPPSAPGLAACWARPRRRAPPWCTPLASVAAEARLQRQPAL